MSSYYKMDPAKWDFGTSELSLEEEAAYLRIINAIHKHDQPVPNNDRVLAGMFRCSTRKARVLVAALIEAGKVRIEGDCITNDKAISDIVQRGFVSGSRAESGAKGGRKRAENAAKSLVDNESGQANASSRIEENRIEIPEANASGRDASESVDPKKEFWEKAKAFLSKNGIPQSQSGSFIGKCLKQHGLDRTRQAFKAAQSERPAEPIPWITACLTKPEHQPAITDNVIRIAMENMERRDQQRAAR